MSEISRIFLGAAAVAAVAAVIVTLGQRAATVPPAAPPTAVMEIEGTATSNRLAPDAVLQPNQWLTAEVKGQPCQFMVKEDCILWWKKADGQPVPVAKIKGSIIGYSVIRGDLPVLQYWNENRVEYLQRCAGVDGNGQPYFGDAEQR